MAIEANTVNVDSGIHLIVKDDSPDSAKEDKEFRQVVSECLNQKPDFLIVTNVTALTISGLPGLKLDNIYSYFPNLNRLEVDDVELRSFNSLMNMTNLNEVVIGNCPLNSLPGSSVYLDVIPIHLNTILINANSALHLDQAMAFLQETLSWQKIDTFNLRTVIINYGILDKGGQPHNVQLALTEGRQLPTIAIDDGEKEVFPVKGNIIHYLAGKNLDVTQILDRPIKPVAASAAEKATLDHDAPDSVPDAPVAKDAERTTTHIVHTDVPDVDTQSPAAADPGALANAVVKAMAEPPTKDERPTTRIPLEERLASGPAAVRPAAVTPTPTAASPRPKSRGKLVLTVVLASAATLLTPLFNRMQHGISNAAPQSAPTPLVENIPAPTTPAPRPVAKATPAPAATPAPTTVVDLRASAATPAPITEGKLPAKEANTPPRKTPAQLLMELRERDDAVVKSAESAGRGL